MTKRITAFILSVALFACTFSLIGCSRKKEETKLTSYSIEATLTADNKLDALVTVNYVNCYDVPLDEVWFELYPNAYREGAANCPIPADKLSEAFPSGRSYSKLDITRVTVNGSECEICIAGDDENVLSVSVPTLEPGDSATITIEYKLEIPKVRHRLGYTEKSVNLANFYPIACVYRDGGFVAEPYASIGDPFFSDVADYNVTLTVPSEYVCAFTGTVTSKSETENGTKYCVEAKNVRDFAAVAGKYEKISGVAGSTIVNYYYYADTKPERALNTAIDAINIFGKLFGEYAYPEYSVVQTGFLHGGMEYPCLTMISDRYTGDSYNDIIIHETAHQWWYAAVGSDEVRYPWLDEGLTEYSTMLFYENAGEGYSYTFDGKRADAMTAYMLYCETYKRNGLDDTSMNRPLGEYENELEYTYMTYVKGALMFDDVRNTIGTAAFMQGLCDYYSGCKFKLATPADLISCMERASRRQLGGLFDSWLQGKVKLYSTN